jgi:quinolinate synthase
MFVESIYRELRAKLHDVAPDAELRLQAEFAEEVLWLKAERNAVILAHHYMEPALFHSVPDYTGDSLELSRRAAATSADVIVFCGVRFMAETAKILNPEKRVLLPSPEAGCSLAAGITARDVRQLKARFPGAPVVCYVNTCAEVKAEADVCCTSGNAAAVVESLHADTVILVPDEFLARNVARQTGREFLLAGGRPALEVAKGRGACLVGWPARCEVHEKFTLSDVLDARRQFPGVTVIAHPECRP